MDIDFWTERLKGAFDSYELCFTRERTKTFEAAQGDLLSKDVKEEEGISLRAIKDGKISFSYTYEQGEKAAAALRENGAVLMPFLDRDPFYAFAPPSGSYPALDLYDEAGLALGEESKIEALIRMESTIRAFDSRITTTRNCELHEAEIEIGMINSNGLEAKGSTTVYALSGMAVAARDGEEVSWYDWTWGSRYGELAGPCPRKPHRTEGRLVFGR